MKSSEKGRGVRRGRQLIGDRLSLCDQPAELWNGE